MSDSMEDSLRQWRGRFGLPPRGAEELERELAVVSATAETLHLLEGLLERCADAGLDPKWLAAPGVASALSRTAYAAPFLIRHFAARPTGLPPLLLEALEGDSRASWETHADPQGGYLLPEEDFLRALRRYKYDNYLKTTVRHLAGLADTPRVCSDTSRLARELFRLAFCRGFAELTGIYGLPLSGGNRGALRLAGGGVVGMGKLGGGELNYSSDVDVIFIHDAGDAPCLKSSSGPELEPDGLPPLAPDMDEAAFWTAQEQRVAGLLSGARGETSESSLSGGEFYNRLARNVMRMLSAGTEHGFCFRVDADLRPQGRSGMLAVNLAYMEDYYLRQGREWERTAMIKARLLTGQEKLAQGFAGIINPFVYRRYLDYSALEGVAIIKHDINRLHQSALESDIKLGRGGIRESEFLVQALQLLYGGKNPDLQVCGHAEAVARLMDAGVVKRDDGEGMLRDYWFLRSLENRTQMVEEAQTHSLPEGLEERLCVMHDFQPGFESRIQEVEDELSRVRARVRERFDALFEGMGDQGFTETAKWRQAVQNHLDPAEHERTLENIDRLFQRLMETRMGERCVFKLGRLLTNARLYRRGTGFAFEGWLRFFEQIGNRNALYTLIDTNPSIVAWVSDIFTEGGKHAEMLLRHPEFLESFFTMDDPWENCRERFAEVYNSSRDEEGFLLELQTLKAQSQIRVLSHYLNQDQYGGHHELLSDLADAVICACTGFAWDKVTGRMGLPQGGGAAREGLSAPGLAVLGLGKLGSRELRFGSDLDLIFVFREQGTTDKGRSHAEFYTRLAQTIGSLLTSQTMFGRLYELDHRLRPFGTRSVLVPSLKSFEDFLDPSNAAGAEIWNFQAFSRLRFICGDRELAGALSGKIAGAWRARGHSPAQVAGAVSTMLEKLVAENLPREESGGQGWLQLKYSTGGLIGYEFLQQARFLIQSLKGSDDWPEPLRGPSRPELQDGYSALGDLDERLSFHVNGYAHRISEEHFRSLAAIADKWNFDQVKALLADQEERVRAEFKKMG
ncbi:MAG: hypothetical protein OEZ59_00995 [Deltaproteobacteria bacterium]|nr:hypothetical protein [Deltaproteobacteria bacterium]